MPTIDGAFINGLLSAPLVLPASLAGALAALFVVIIVIAIRRAASGGGARLLIPLTAIAVAAIAVIGVLERLATNERMAEQRALLLRHTQLSLSAVAPGSALACLDGAAGEQIETACEKSVFADAQSAASAVAYIGARLSLGGRDPVRQRWAGVGVANLPGSPGPCSHASLAPALSARSSEEWSNRGTGDGPMDRAGVPRCSRHHAAVCRWL